MLMKFTVARTALEKLLKAVASRPGEPTAQKNRVLLSPTPRAVIPPALKFRTLLKTSRHAFLNFRGTRGRIARQTFLDTSARLTIHTRNRRRSYEFSGCIADDPSSLLLRSVDASYVRDAHVP